MKEATGELNMTVVTVVAITAVGAFFYAFVWPSIKTGLMTNTCKNVCPNGNGTAGTDKTAKATKDGENYVCTCPDNTTIKVDENGNPIE